VTGYSKDTLTKAKRLRRGMTEAERKLWSALRNSRLAGAKFRRQQPIGPFIADFVCFEQRLIIEADGSQHCDSARDCRRDAYLQAQGFRVLRFWNNHILCNLQGVTEVMTAALTSPHPPKPPAWVPPSPARGEGLNGSPSPSKREGLSEAPHGH
jgi:very-short-patch-repair endonuclease